jgi:high-affinity iron transporter
MGAAFLITLRDGVEAALIIAIVMAYLRQLGRTDRFTPVLGGALAGAVVSLGVGIGVYLAIGELEGRAELYVEATTALLAAGVLTWMIFWMRRQARTIGGELRSRVNQAIASGAVLGLASITFIGVLREGIEMSLFLLAVVFDSGTRDTAIGGFAGLGAAMVVGYALYRGGQFVNLRVFFQVTAGLIILFAAGLLGKGVFELQEAGLFNSAYWPVWDVHDHALLGRGQFAAFMKGIFGWSAQPSIEQVVVWVAYATTASWFFYFFRRLPAFLSTRIDQLSAAIRGLLPPAIASAVEADPDA